MHVTDQPAETDVAHDVFDRGERVGCIRLVVHGQENAGQNLQHKHQQRQRAEVVPKIEILRRVVLGDVLFPHRRQREALIDPAANGFDLAHVYDSLESAPTSRTASLI